MSMQSLDAVEAAVSAAQRRLTDLAKVAAGGDPVAVAEATARFLQDTAPLLHQALSDHLAMEIVCDDEVPIDVGVPPELLERLGVTNGAQVPLRTIISQTRAWAAANPAWLEGAVVE
jgi:hypothetical protein